MIYAMTAVALGFLAGQGAMIQPQVAQPSVSMMATVRERTRPLHRARLPHS